MGRLSKAWLRVSHWYENGCIHRESSRADAGYGPYRTSTLSALSPYQMSLDTTYPDAPRLAFHATLILTSTNVSPGHGTSDTVSACRRLKLNVSGTVVAPLTVAPSGYFNNKE